MIRLPRLSAVAAGALALVAVSVVPARAQYGRPMVSEPAIGEKYHVEAIINFWNPNLDAVISSESLGIPGSDIDVKTDLGYVDKSVREFRFVLRPAASTSSASPTPRSSTRATCCSRARSSSTASRSPSACRSRPSSSGTRGGSATSTTSSTPTAASPASSSKPATPMRSSRLHSPIDNEFIEAKGPVPAVRRHRPGLRAQARVDHRRDHRHEGAGDRGLRRQLLRPRHLRHGELHPQLRRAGRLSHAGRRVHGQEATPATSRCAACTSQASCASSAASRVSAVPPTRPARACRCWSDPDPRAETPPRRDGDGHDAIAGAARDVEVPDLAGRQVDGHRSRCPTRRSTAPAAPP